MLVRLRKMFFFCNSDRAVAHSYGNCVTSNKFPSHFRWIFLHSESCCWSNDRQWRTWNLFESRIISSHPSIMMIFRWMEAFLILISVVLHAESCKQEWRNLKKFYGWYQWIEQVVGINKTIMKRVNSHKQFRWDEGEMENEHRATKVTDRIENWNSLLFEK